MDEFGEHPEKLIETQSSLNWPSSAIKPFESGSCSALWQSFAKSIFLWPSQSLGGRGSGRLTEGRVLKN